jgi:hypothetical protein
MFRPHDFKTTIIGVPTIHISESAYRDMWHLVDEVTTEVGWLGVVRQDSLLSFFIEEIFLIEQDVSAATTELDETGLAKLYERLLAQDKGIDKVNALRFWGHSHVNMDTGPSAQDETQMGLFKKNECPWFIRGIFNKKGKASFDVFYFDLGLTYRDCEWKLVADTKVTDPRRLFWQGEIKEKVKLKTYQTYVHGEGGYPGWSGRHNYSNGYVPPSKGFNPHTEGVTYRAGKWYDKDGKECPNPVRHPIHDPRLRSNRDPVQLDKELDALTRTELAKEFGYKQVKDELKSFGIEIDDGGLGIVSDDPAVVQAELKKGDNPKMLKSTDGGRTFMPPTVRTYPPGVDPKKVEEQRQPTVQPRNGDTFSDDMRPGELPFGFSDGVE